MSAYPPEEIRTSYERYVETRSRVEAGELSWDALAAFFTENAIFVDPAWGRVDGIDGIREFLKESMAGLEDWTFPHQWSVVEGNRLVAFWMNRLAGERANGTPYKAPGVSIMEYAGDGRFSSEIDLLNMVHVGELIAESGWTPPPSFNMPPRSPRRW